MADWKIIPDTDVDPDAPVTSELMYALRDNPVALAEGATGAPRVMGVALDTFIGYNNTPMTQSSPVAFVGLEGIGEVLVSFSADGIDTTSRTHALQVSFTNNNGVTWGGWVSLSDYIIPTGATASARGCSYLFTISMNDAIACMLVGSSGPTPVRSGNTVSSISGIPIGANGFRFRQSLNFTVGGTTVACWAIGGVT